MGGKASKTAHIDCTQYSGYQDFHAKTGITCNPATFSKRKREQLNNASTIPTTARSIDTGIQLSDKDGNSSCSVSKNLSTSNEKMDAPQNKADLPNSGKMPEKAGVPDDLAYRISDTERRDLIGLAISSLRKHIPTQWQAAATTLERLVPQQFAKRVVPEEAGKTMGLRLVITDDPNGNRVTTIEGAIK